MQKIQGGCSYTEEDVPNICDDHELFLTLQDGVFPKDQ